MERKRLIRNSQHSFVKGRLCLTNLNVFFKEIRKWIDVGKAVDVIYMDFGKATDIVPNGTLVQKFRACGI